VQRQQQQPQHSIRRATRLPQGLSSRNRQPHVGTPVLLRFGRSRYRRRADGVSRAPRFVSSRVPVSAESSRSGRSGETVEMRAIQQREETAERTSSDGPDGTPGHCFCLATPRFSLPHSRERESRRRRQPTSPVAQVEWPAGSPSDRFYRPAAWRRTIAKATRRLPAPAKLPASAPQAKCSPLTQTAYEPGSTAIASIETSKPRGSRTWAGADRAGGGSGI